MIGSWPPCPSSRTQPATVSTPTASRGWTRCSTATSTTGKLPGWSVAVVRHDELVHTGLGGRRDVEAALPVAPDTVFRIYSMTKPITSVAAMVLWEQGAFELRDPVSSVLPAFADVRVFDGGSDLKPVTVPAVEPMRLWHLLTHTSGLTYGFHRNHPVDSLYRAAGFDFGTDPQVSDLAGVERAARGHAAAVPARQRVELLDEHRRPRPRGRGGVRHAAGPGAGRAGAAPARAWTRPGSPCPKRPATGFAALYVPTPGPGLSRQDAVGASFLEPKWLSGGGGLSSTLGDYVRFTRFLARGGELDGVRLLGDRTRSHDGDQPPAGRCRTCGTSAARCSPSRRSTASGFGLGFSVVLDPVATPHGGQRGEFAWGGAASTAFWVDPVEDLTAVFMTQLLPSSHLPVALAAAAARVLSPGRPRLTPLAFAPLDDRGEGHDVNEDRVALVTGGSAGIGERTAIRLQQAGFTVYAVARRVDAMRELADAGVHTFAMDVTDDASMTAGVQRIVDEAGRLDVLVNNAGYGSFGAVEDVPLDEARRQFEVNVFGLARLVQLALPHMRAQGSGRIVNVSSIGGKVSEPLGAWYHATKFAVEGLSDSLRLEVAPFGIHVVLVEPGPIRSEWNAIARKSMVTTAGGGAYAERATRIAATFEKADNSRLRSSMPDVVARRIVKAATVAAPRARYPVGRGAGTIIRTRRLLPDRLMDRVVTRVIG